MHIDLVKGLVHELSQFPTNRDNIAELARIHTGLCQDANMNFDQSAEDWNATAAAIVQHFNIRGPNAKA
jgi:hypothetical protein